MSEENALYSITPPKSLVEMTSEELGEALDRTSTVIVPVGSVEQHGPHLPLGTDALQGAEMGRAVVRKLQEDGVEVVLGPTVPFGRAPYHLEFPGTISLRTSTLQALLRDVCESLLHHGFRNIVLLLAHGGNWAVMQTVVQDLTERHEEGTFLALNWVGEMHEAYKDILETKDSGHAGEGETARGLVSHPKLVQLDRAKPYFTEKMKEVEGPETPLLGGGVFYGTESIKGVTPYGSTGDPTAAEPETGRQSYDVIAEFAARVIKRDLT